jgi:hypothetical protein
MTIRQFASSFEIEGRVDGGCERRFLRWQQVPDPLAESRLGDCDYIVAVHYRIMAEAVGVPDRDLDGQATRGRSNWRDGYLGSLQDDQFPGKNQDRACLIQVRDMNRPH